MTPASAVVAPTEPAVWMRTTGFRWPPIGADQELLGLHDALEHVRRLADDDGVDVLVLQAGVEQRAIDRLAHQARRC